jgi:transposase
VNDSTQTLPLLEGLPLPRHLLADKAYHTNRLVDWLSKGNVDVVIPPMSGRLYQRPYNRQRYKQRNCIERCIHKLKHCRHIATRYDKDKTAQSYLVILALACALIWLRF